VHSEIGVHILVKIETVTDLQLSAETASICNYTVQHSPHCCAQMDSNIIFLTVYSVATFQTCLPAATVSIYVHACCSNIMCYSGGSYEVTNDLAECDSSLHGVLLTLLEHDWLH